MLALLGASLGWRPDDLHARLFAWKHRENPFGVSPAWVATVDDEIVGFRTFLRWEFVVDGEPVRAVRAVDTATHPDHRGRGVFAGLTAHALDALRDDGVAFVFNTPNDQSRPGYLKMGWRPVRRLAVLARPGSVGALGRIARARTAADKWSLPRRAVCRPPRPSAPAARRSLPAPARHPACTAPIGRLPDVAVRLRAARLPRREQRRSRSRHRRVPTAPTWPGGRGCRVRGAGQDPGETRRLLGRVLRESGADYAVRVGDHLPRARFMPLPGRGPILVCRQLSPSPAPPPEAWHLGLGDVELF